MEVEGLDRYKPLNPYNYTDDQLGEKKVALYNASIAFPTVPPLYAEWCYDVVMNTPRNELDAMMERIRQSEGKKVSDKENKQE